MSKNYRKREYPRTDLLGAPDSMACPLERRWRNYLRVSEIPWLQDHRIQSDIIFPAAGYIAIAVEAIIQIIKDSDHIEELTLQDIQIRSAMIVPEAAGVEVMTSLRDSDKALIDEEDQRYEFHIYSVSSDNRWVEHCTGVIGTQTDSSLIDGETFVDLNGHVTAPASSDASHITVVDIPQFYEELHVAGLEYGPCFSNLKFVHATQQGLCFAEVTIPDTGSVMPMNFEHPSLIHPCTLDSIFHTVFAALPDMMGLENGPLIPVSLEKMQISSQIQRSAGEVLSICTHVQPEPKKNIVASITATDNINSVSSTKPKLSIHGLRCARLEISSSHAEKKDSFAVAYAIEWQADPSFISRENASIPFQQQGVDQIQVSDLREEYEKMAECVIKDTIVSLSEESDKKFESLNSRYRDDFTTILGMHNQDNQINSYNGQIAKGEGFRGVSRDMEALLRAVSRHLCPFPPRDLETFRDAQGEIWGTYRNVIARNPAYCAAADYVGLIGNKKPDISVLEIGDGGNRPYNLFLRRLMPRCDDGQSRIPLCSRYIYGYRDDYGPDQAKEDLADWKEVVSFEKVVDLSEQELGKQAYDVIIAPNAFYSLYSASDGLLKIRSLLKPFGYLIILNTLQTERSLLDTVLVTAFYHWPHRRVDSFVHNERTSGEILRGAGFKTEYIMEGALTVCRPHCETDSFDKKILIIREDDNELSINLSKALMEQLPGESTASNPMEARPQGCICIVLSDLNRSLFEAPDNNLLQKLKEIFLQSEGVLWVTRGGTMHATNPQCGLAIGFARTARSESGVQPIITLDLDPNLSIMDESRVNIIIDLMKPHFFQGGRPEYDVEYAEREGIVLIPRVIIQDDLNCDIMERNQKIKSFQQPFHQPGICLFLQLNEVGENEVHFTASNEVAEISEGHVGIKVFAFAVSEFDIEADKNMDAIFSAVGYGCSGQVCEIGSNVRGFSVGDRVACIGTGTARNCYYDQASAFQKIEGNVSYELAASLPLAYTAAYYIVNELARIKRGGTVLIHDAASWYGKALAEICMLNGSEIFAIVSNEDSKNEILETFEIASWQVIVDGKDNIARRLLELTNGKPPSTVITSADSSTKIFKTLCKLTAPFGHLIHLRTRPLENHQAVGLFSWDLKNISFSTFDIFNFQFQTIVPIYEIWSKVISLFKQRKLRGSSSYSVHKVTNVTNAMSAVSSAKYAVITANADEIISVRLSLNTVI